MTDIAHQAKQVIADAQAAEREAMPAVAKAAERLLDGGFLDIRQVSVLLNVDEETARRMIRTKKLPAYKVAGSRQYRVSRVELAIYLETHRTVPR